MWPVSRCAFAGGGVLSSTFPYSAATRLTNGRDVVGCFLRKREDGQRRDVFAAMVCLWWSAINLLDVAIYCADSRVGELMLLDGLTGKESDGHDWNNLLTRWGLLDQDTAIARWMRAIAALVCVASLGIALWSVLQQPRERLGEASTS